MRLSRFRFFQVTRQGVKHDVIVSVTVSCARTSDHPSVAHPEVRSDPGPEDLAHHLAEQTLAEMAAEALERNTAPDWVLEQETEVNANAT